MKNKSELCTSLPDTVAASLQTSFWDTNQFVQSNGTNTLAKSSENEQQMDGSQICQCGKGTSDCSIHPSTREKWIASMQASLARIFQPADCKKDLEKEPDQDSTGKYCESLTWYDHDSYSWKTWQQSFTTDWELFSGTWPSWGLMLDGVVYGLQTLEQVTEEIDGGSLLPTPTVCGNHNRVGASKNSGDGLVTALLKRQQFPTPNAFQGKNVGRLDELGGKGNQFRKTDAGKQLLNPLFVEELMGFPIEWTGLKVSEMPKSRSRQQSPTVCSEVSE